MTARSRPTVASGALALVTLAWLAPASALGGTISLGIQGGHYRSETQASDGASSEFYQPVIDVQHDRLGASFKVVTAGFGLDQAFTDVIPGTEGFSPDIPFRTDVDTDIDRRDVDIALRYRLGPYLDGRLGVGIFTGLRWELIETVSTATVRFENVPPELAEFFPGTRQVSRSDISKMAVPLGVSVDYLVADAGLSPFLVLTLFPLARADTSSFIIEGIGGRGPAGLLQPRGGGLRGVGCGGRRGLEPLRPGGRTGQRHGQLPFPEPRPPETSTTRSTRRPSARSGTSSMSSDPPGGETIGLEPPGAGGGVRRLGDRIRGEDRGSATARAAGEEAVEEAGLGTVGGTVDGPVTPFGVRRPDRGQGPDASPPGRPPRPGRPR